MRGSVVVDEEIAKMIRASKGDDDLYDPDNGIRRDVLRQYRFLDCYLTFHSAHKQDCPKAQNWITAAQSYRQMVAEQIDMVIFWTWEKKLPCFRGVDTHARGVFVDKERKVVITYEPRGFNPPSVTVRNKSKKKRADITKEKAELHEARARYIYNAERRHYNKAHKEFLNKFGNSFSLSLSSGIKATTARNGFCDLGCAVSSGLKPPLPTAISARARRCFCVAFQTAT
jgi:hypothetical protein